MDAGMADDIWYTIEYHIPKNKRAKIARDLIKLFDCDCSGTIISKAGYKPCPVCNHNSDGRAYKIKQCQHCDGKGFVPR